MCQFKTKVTQLPEHIQWENRIWPFVCTVCLQTWFKSSVRDVSKLFLEMQIEQNMFAECSKGFTSVNSKEWLCRKCHFAIKQGKVPRLLVKNGMGFPEQPPELQLYPREECLISSVLTFFQMRCNPIGGWAFVWGNVVNIPVDIAHTVKLLPQNLNDIQTAAIKFKCKKEYKNVNTVKTLDLYLFGRQHIIWCKTDLNKNLGIKLDTKWLNHVVNKENDTENMPFIVNEHDVFPSTSNDNYCNTSEMNTEEVVCDEIDEDDETCCCWQRYNVSWCWSLSKRIDICPGEGKKPISLFTNKNIEYFAFPPIFCGGRHERRDVTVHYDEICKYKLRSVDRRVAKNVPNMFFKLKKVQMKSIKDKVTLAMRWYNPKGKKYVFVMY